jgi:hypothetical protein
MLRTGIRISDAGHFPVEDRELGVGFAKPSRMPRRGEALTHEERAAADSAVEEGDAHI